MEAIKKIFEIDLDVKRSTTSRVANKVKQGDNGNVFIITMTHDGEPIDLTGTKILAVFSKTDGTAQQDTDGHGVTVDPEKSNVIIVELYTTSFAPGLVECEIQILSGEDYNTLITSARFNFECDRAILNEDTIQATDEYPILVGLLDRVEEVEEKLLPIEENEDARLAAEEERIAAETARQEAETEREQAELLREQEEEDRIADEEIRIGNEASRKEAENQRYLAESGRVSAETARANAEAARVSAETTRQQNETARVSAETARVTAENARVSAETARVAADTAREKKWNNPTATASTLAAGSAATVSANIGANGVAFTFGIPKGDKGDKGDSVKGDKGDPGSGLTILGYYESAAALESSVTKPAAGDTYGVGTAKPYDFYVWDGVNKIWKNNGNLFSSAVEPIIVSDTEPSETPYFWFNTGVTLGTDTIATLNLTETDDGTVSAVVDGTEYSVGNTTVGETPTPSTYNFDLIY